MDTLPAISVVVPSLNQGRYLDDALRSIFRQNYPRLQVVLMDGGSTDNTAEIIRAYDSRLTYWQSQPDGGQGAAINEGVRHCSGDLVGWLNSDDYYLRDSLWTLARAHAASPKRGLYIGNGFRRRQEDGTLTPFSRRHVALNRDALVNGLDYVLQPSTFFSTDAWEAVGGLDPSLRFCLDWDLLIRVAQKYPAVLINEFLSVSREHRATKTSTGHMERILEIQRMVKLHTGREASLGTLYYWTEALLHLSDGSIPAQVRGPLGTVQTSVRHLFGQAFGHSDGFPEKTDADDTIYLPLATADGPAEPADIVSWPSISVVVPSLDQAAFLGQALDSILNQGYPRAEVIVCDGGSTDGSVEVLKQYQHRLAYWVSERDRGPAHAINKGFARATGDILGWLNSDDMLTAGALAEVGRAFAEDPDLDMVYANALYVDESTRLHLADHGGYRTGLYYGEMLPRDRTLRYWSYVHAVPQPTVFFRRRLLDACGPLDERYHFIFDFELFFRFAEKARIKKLERTQAFYRIHRAAKSSDWRKFLIELYRLSRPSWPGLLDRDFYPRWQDFLGSYARRHFGGGARTGGQWAILASAAISSLTGVGNPETLAARGTRAPLGSSTARGRAFMPRRQSYAIDRDLRYRSFFCSLTLPKHPGHSGGEIRDFHLLRQLLQISTVEFFAVHPLPSDDRVNVLEAFLDAVHAPDTVRTAPQTLPSRLVGAAQRRHWPVLGARYHTESKEQLAVTEHCRILLEKALEDHAPDFLFISPQVNPIALTFDTSALRTRLVMASYDVEAERIESFAKASRGLQRFVLGLEGKRARRFESENLRAFDGIIAVSDRDKDTFVGRYDFSPDRVLVVANSVDPHYFAFAERRAARSPQVVFVGTLDYLANRRAAWRLVDDVMPRVRRRCPQATVWIVGQNPEPALLARADGRLTVVTGAVDDVRPYLADATVACIPLTAGAGTKYKVLEALSAGVPTVCTPSALKGLDLRDGEHLLVRDSDEELSGAIVDLIERPQLAERLARQGRDQVERLYTWDANLPRLDDWLRLLDTLPRRGGGQRTGR